MPFANVAPFEIIAAPYEVWSAPVGTAFPDVDDAAPANPWAIFGTSGTLNMNDDPVVVQHPQTIITFRPAGDTGERKASRTEEGLIVTFSLVDMTVEQYLLSLNSNAMTTEAAASGTPGRKYVGLSRGPLVNEIALLVRGPSAYGTNMSLQYEVYRAYEASSPQVSLSKGAWAVRSYEYRALVNGAAPTPAERFGRLRQMTAAALP